MRLAFDSTTPTNVMHVPTAIPIRVVSSKVQDADAHPVESVTESVLTSEARYKERRDCRSLSPEREVARFCTSYE